MAATYVKYNTPWTSGDPANIEIAIIKRGGYWDYNGQRLGHGLYYHFKELQKLLWPTKKWHRWNEMMLREFLSKKMIGILAPASAGKTREAADYALCCYFCWPNETTVLISSTDMRSLELRIWGEIKKQFNIAKERFPWLPGNPIGSKMMITTSGKLDLGRDFRNAIVGVPCVVGGQFVGIGKYVGIKNKRVIQIADECQFMHTSFLDASANLSKNEWYQLIGLGNPMDRDNPHGKLCEPADELGGWDGLAEATKSRTWPTRFADGVAIQLIGTDSPNFDDPPDQYPFLINKRHIENDLKYYGKDSLQFTMMSMGTLPGTSANRRVITRSICVQFGALEPVVWSGGDGGITKILGLDAAYSGSGGDRCVLTEIHVGEELGGKRVISFAGKPTLVPTNRKSAPEDQIAEFVRDYATSRGISPDNVFYDSTGRGTLGTAFARVWSPMVNPVEFGGKASDRPVGGEVKLTCKEYYSKFVSELWYFTRRLIEAGQLRNLPQDVMDEGCLREWKMVSGNRIEVEAKDETKKRMGRSPDLYDSFVVAVEGARRRGFTLGVIGHAREEVNRKWLEDMVKQRKQLTKRNTLSYAA